MEGLVRQEGAKTLVVVFHGVGALLPPMEPLLRAIHEIGEGADVLMPQRWSGMLSNADPVAITREAVSQVDELVEVHSYEKIVLVGYSAGGLFARKFVVYAHGQQEDAPFEEGASTLFSGRRWASTIRRVVLLAGMNRGWEFAPTKNRFKVAGARLAYSVGRASGNLRLLGALRRGAPFVADLRNQWMSLTRSGRLEGTIVVQLLGTIDDIVSPEDNFDAETGNGFYYLDVPGSGHNNVRDFNDPDYGGIRKAKFVSAFKDGPDDLKREHVPPPPPPYSVDENVKRVLFVIHGIRDYGFWTAHLARHVVHKIGDMQRTVALTPTYGFFAMLPFLLPTTRSAKIRWLMDQYTEALARFPNATSVSYIGHSNGTYLLVGALHNYRTCHFDKVVFAGSVVRSDFDWAQFIANGRVRAVLNYVADGDWVVALFPRFLGGWGADVGGAGWDGFTSDRDAVPPLERHRIRHRGAFGGAPREELGRHRRVRCAGRSSAFEGLLRAEAVAQVTRATRSANLVLLDLRAHRTALASNGGQLVDGHARTSLAPVAVDLEGGTNPRIGRTLGLMPSCGSAWGVWLNIGVEE